MLGLSRLLSFHAKRLRVAALPISVKLTGHHRDKELKEPDVCESHLASTAGPGEGTLAMDIDRVGDFFSFFLFPFFLEAVVIRICFK